MKYLLCGHLKLHELSFSTQNVPRCMNFQKSNSREVALKKKPGHEEPPKSTKYLLRVSIYHILCSIW